MKLSLLSTALFLCALIFHTNTYSQCFATSALDTPIELDGVGYFTLDCENAPNESTIDFTGLTGILGTDLEYPTIDISIAHTYSADLSIFLVSPAGTELLLASEIGGIADDTFIFTSFVNEGDDITLAAVPYIGAYTPMGGSFESAFEGESIEGVWTLKVCDVFADDTGTILDFNMGVCAILVPTCGDETACNYEPSPFIDNSVCTYQSWFIPFDIDNFGPALLLCEDGNIPVGYYMPDAQDCVQSVVDADTYCADPDGFWDFFCQDAFDDCGDCVLVVVCPEPEISAPCDNVPDPVPPVIINECNLAVDIDFNDALVSGSCAGIVVRTWSINAENGNFIECVQLITLIDDTAPEIICPANYTYDCSEAIVNNEQPLAFDNCSVDVMVSSSDEIIAGCGGGETILRTWVATDNCGNQSECLQIIEVTANALPVLECPQDVFLNCNEPQDYGEIGIAYLGCSELMINYDEEIIFTGCETIINRFWEVVDECGNQVGCQQQVTIDNSDCPLVSGCTYDGACNFNPEANFDDRTCVYPGCTDPFAANYDDNAGCEDFSSCVYLVVCDACPGDLTGDYVVTAADLTVLLSNFGVFCPIIN